MIMLVMLVVKFGKIICFGLNYVDYIKEGGYDVLDYLVLFMCFLMLMILVGVLMVCLFCFE